MLDFQLKKAQEGAEEEAGDHRRTVAAMKHRVNDVEAAKVHVELYVK